MLTSEREIRPLSFIASISGELVVVSALILIPLTYNERVPDFHWSSIGVTAPLKQIAPKPIAPRLLRRASSGLSFPRRFIEPLRPQSHDLGTAPAGPDFGDAPTIETNSESSGNPGQLAAAFPEHMATVEPPPPIRKSEMRSQPAGPVRVSAGVQMAMLVRKVVPEYPPLARSARVSGVVHLIGVIARDGRIRNLQLVSGHPLLVRAALEAVQQWIYRPTLLNGEPVEVIAPIDVYFTLGQ